MISSLNHGFFEQIGYSFYTASRQDPLRCNVQKISLSDAPAKFATPQLVCKPDVADVPFLPLIAGEFCHHRPLFPVPATDGWILPRGPL